MENKKLVRWPRLVVGFIALLFAGIVYAWSIMKAPFFAYYDATQLGFNYTLTIILLCLGGCVSGLVSKKCSSTLRLSVSAVLIFAGFLIVSRLVDGGGPAIRLYLAYGVLVGLGIGVVFNAAIATTNLWFPDKQGLCSGVLLTGFGLSSFIIGRIADTMGRSEAIGWKNTYVIFAILIGVVLLIAAQLIKPPPEGMVFPAPKKSGKGAETREIKEFSTREMIKRPLFYVTFISTALIIVSGSAAFSFATDIVTDVGGTTNFAVTTVGILAVFNSLGRLVSGWLFDKVGLIKTKIVYGAFNFLGPLTVVVALVTSSLFFGVTGLCLCSFAYGFTPTANSVFATRFFGPKYFSLNYAVINMILIPASFTATLVGWLKDTTDGFLAAFIIIAALATAGSIIVVCLRSRK